MDINIYAKEVTDMRATRGWVLNLMDPHPLIRLRTPTHKSDEPTAPLQVPWPRA